MLTMAVTNEETPGPSEYIDRLALRISLADIDEQFETVVQKSLVFILKYLAKYEDHRKKLMELLGDVTRRLKCRPNIQVPVQELFLTYNDPARQVFLVNFSHLYIVIGYPRLPFPQQAKLLPVLYASLTDDKPVCQHDALLHLTLPFIGNITPELVPRDLGLSELPLQRNLIMEFYSLILLAPYSSYDLSRVAHERYSKITCAEDLEKFKVGLIQFYSKHFFPAEESIIPILFGYGDTRHSVVSAAAKELRTLSMIVDWEDELLLTRIMAWYLGRRRECDPRGRNEPRRPLSANMRIKLGHYLLRSRITLPGPLAPSLVEAALLALESASMPPMVNNGQQPPPPPPPQQLQQQQPQPPYNSVNSTLEHSTHVCEGGCGHAHPTPSIPMNRSSAEDSGSPGPTGTNSVQRSAAATYSLIQQRRLAEHGLDLLAHLINNVTALNGPASVAALRCLINFVYEKTPDELTYVRARGFELLSRFLGRDPNYLLKDPAQLPRLFSVLSEDNPTELKLAAAHCLRRLAITFQDAQRQNYPALRGQLSKLERLLYENIEKPDPLCRLVAVNFAGLIYPSDHIPTRYLILQALGDKDPRVRAEACMAFEQFLDPNIIHDIVYGRVKLPSFVEFVNHDTQHSRKNPFVEVERLIPVVQFIRLCLLATRGGLTPAQEAALTYETEDEVRYLINQTVRYFLTAGNGAGQSGSGTNTGSGGASVVSASTGPSPTGSPTAVSSNASLNPEQAKRSIDTYFRLIQVVIFTRSQHTKESPDFPNYLEEVLVGNTRELITCNKQLFDRMNNVLLATPRGANCRHACASVYSVVVMETETPTQALQTAKNMLNALPSAGSPIDGESSHAVQGMFMGAAYLLERLFSRHVATGTPSALALMNAAQATGAAASSTADAGTAGTSTKKSRKEKQQQQKQLRADIIATIEHLVTLMSGFLIKPNSLYSVPTGSGAKDKRTADGDWYVNANVAQATVAALLEALMVLARAGCLSHLPAGTLPISGTPNLVSSKAALIHQIASYFPTPATYGASNSELVGALSGQPRVAQAALRALAACCMGEGTERITDVTGNNNAKPVPATVTNTATGLKAGESPVFVSHPHTVHILKLMTNIAEVNDPSLHLAVGTSIADCLLGPTSPLKYHWYERSYPLLVPPEAVAAAVESPGGVWLAGQLESLLTHRPGQVQTRPATLAAAFWALALVRRMGPPPSSLLPVRLIVDLLEEKDESVQCVAVATLGLIYDRSNEEARTELVNSLTKTIVGSEKRQGSPIYRELCGLAQQIGRPDLALSLIVLAIALPPNARLSSSSSGQHATSNVACNLAASVTYAGLVRRLGRALAPALPRLVPRIFIRRFDYARPRLRQAMENVWLGLVSYASNSATPSLVCVSSCSTLNLPTSTGQSSGTQPGQLQQQQQQTPQTSPNHVQSNSVHALASEMIEAHFNAIICEIKTQLGFNTPSGIQLSSASSNADSFVGTGTLVPSSMGQSGIGSGTQNACLRDACCLAIASLTTHPSADKRLAGHLPALLSGLLGLCDEYGSVSQPVATSREHSQSTASSSATSPPEEAAVAVQKLVIRVLENPCSREAAAGLLPGLLPVIIDRAPWTLGSSNGEMDPIKSGRTAQPSESRRLALELLLAAARTARPSALRPALPQLVLAGLHTMASVHPSLVASLMRQPVHHLHQLHHHHHHQQQFSSSLSSIALPSQSPGSMGLTACAVQTGGSAPTTAQLQQQQPPIPVSPCGGNNKEVHMAEVLRLCVRLIDDVCLSRLVVPFTELIRAGGGSATANIGASSATGGSRGTGARESAAIATATCVFLSHLAAVNASALAAHASGRNDMCLRCSSATAGTPVLGFAPPTGESPTGSPHKLHPSPCGSAHSSPPSMCALSPTANVIHTLISDGNLVNNTDTVGNSVAPATVHRGRTSAKLAVSPGSSINSPTTATVGSPASATSVPGSGSAGGGFASLVPHTGKLLAALLSALPGACRHPESAGKTVQGEMARTLASLLRFAKDTSVAKLFNRVRIWYLNPDSATSTNTPASASISHWACARVLHAVAHHCPDLLYAHAGITLPLIFLNRQSEPSANCLVYSKVLRDLPCPINLPLVQNPCSSIAESMDTENRASPGTTVSAKGNAHATDDLELLRTSWQETWDELVSKTPAASCSSNPAHLPCLPIALPCGSKLYSPTVTGFIEQFLHRPLLDHCGQLIQDALLDSPSWSVRTQTACALQYLCARLLSYSALLPPSVKRTGCIPSSARTADNISPRTKDSSSTVINDSASADFVEDKCPSDNEIDNPEMKEVVDAVEEWVGYAWNLIAQLTYKALSSCKSWIGKIHLLRTARMLALHVRERGLTMDSTKEDTIEQLWTALLRETRAKRAESIGPGYRVEALLSLAVFAEVFSKDAIHASTNSASEDESGTDRLNDLIQLLVPQWAKREKYGVQPKSIVFNPELNELEQELGIAAVGIMWPMTNQKEEPAMRLASTIALLNLALTRSAKRAHGATLASVTAILAKLSNDQCSKLVQSSDKKTASIPQESGLLEFLTILKRIVENPKSESLREHALGCVAAFLQHLKLTNACRDQLTQILQVLSKEGSSNLNERVNEMLKGI
ncbi:Proteasome-associated protein ECM29 [Fasciola hepatica]|uniref:Proteasome-associated protein ECM29 n=1 Tax=Fasciola hepatica TaxID=6192 RepID=A0A4E0RF76_FASHE|nr:Proteasome-associated protein ECM29 [Fasciola hepatica]